MKFNFTKLFWFAILVYAVGFVVGISLPQLLSQSLEQATQDSAAQYLVSSDIVVFLKIIVTNALLGIAVLVCGLLWSVPSVGIVLFNGFVYGAVIAKSNLPLRDIFIYGTIHAVPEILAICISLALAFSLTTQIKSIFVKKEVSIFWLHFKRWSILSLSLFLLAAIIETILISSI